MKAETKTKLKVKAQKAWAWTKKNIPELLFWTGVSVAVTGSVMSYAQNEQILELQKTQLENEKRLGNLERETNILFEHALEITEGKKEL